MIGFGLLIGVIFPPVVVLLGVPRFTAIRPAFFVATITAGLIVAEVNYLLARGVVGVRVRSLAGGMRRVEATLIDAVSRGNWSGCAPESCKVPIDSTDELGEVAASFNRLVESLAFSHQVSGGVKAVSEALAAHLELSALADSTLNELVDQTHCHAVCLLVANHGRLEVAGARGILDVEALAASEPVASVLRTGEAIILALPADVVISGALVDFVPKEVRILPIRYGTVSVGVLVVGFPEASLPEASPVLAASLPSLAVALNNALNHADLQRVAAVDPLTGVYNRRFGLQRLSEEFSRTVRTGDPLGVMMFDPTISRPSMTRTGTWRVTACCSPSPAAPGECCAKVTFSCDTAVKSSLLFSPAPDGPISNRWRSGSGASSPIPPFLRAVRTSL